MFFAEYSLFYGALLKKTPVILRSLLIEAIPYVSSMCRVCKSPIHIYACVDMCRAACVSSVHTCVQYVSSVCRVCVCVECVRALHTYIHVSICVECASSVRVRQVRVECAYVCSMCRARVECAYVSRVCVECAYMYLIRVEECVECAYVASVSEDCTHIYAWVDICRECVHSCAYMRLESVETVSSVRRVYVFCVCLIFEESLYMFCACFTFEGSMHVLHF